MRQYLDLLDHILKNGVDKGDRTGVGIRSVFGYQMRFPMNDGQMPLLTTKKLHTRSIIYELLWFLKGDTNVKYLHDNKVTIWDEWADENGDLGPIYGHQWRHWDTNNGGYIDQIGEVIEQIKHNPNSRRLVVNSWNVSQIKDMALPPCHCMFQFYVAAGRLSLQMYQRSTDVFLGLPFNIASYSILLAMVAQVTGLERGDFIHTSGDTHLYSNHFAQAREQLTREPYPLPTLRLNPDIKNINDFKFEDIEILNYRSHPHIKADVAV